jgi:hypothetical protein
MGDAFESLHGEVRWPHRPGEAAALPAADGKAVVQPGKRRATARRGGGRL